VAVAAPTTTPSGPWPGAWRSTRWSAAR